MDKKTNNIFFHKIFKAIADSTIKIFIPLYILKITGILYLSILFLVTQSLCVLLSMFLFKKLLQKHGLLCIILHCIPIIATQGLISFCYLSWWIVVLCGVLMALAQTLYSIPLNILFANIDKNTNVAKFQVASNIGKLCFILISGLILSKNPNSFLYLSIVASLFYIVSILPISFSYKYLKEKLENNLSNINLTNQTQNTDIKVVTTKKQSENKPSLWFRVFHVCFGLFQITIETILPLYLYINNLSFETVTTTIAIIELLKIITNYLAKHLINKKRFITCSVISFVVFIASLFFIIIIKNATVLYILSCLISVSFPLTFVPMFKIFCNNALNNNCVNQQMYSRDVDIFAHRPLFYSLAFISNSLLPCLLIAFPIVLLSFISQINVYRHNI